MKIIRSLKNIFWKADSFLLQFSENILNENQKNILQFLKGTLVQNFIPVFIAYHC